jgi:signal peptidase
MTGTLVRWARRILSATFALLAASVLLVGLGARVAPAAGLELFSIRSGSMEPQLTIGSLAIVERKTEGLSVGRAVAFRLPSGVVVTHRVIEVVETANGTFLRTRGDANEDPDPSLVPMSAVIGPVMASLPLLGFLLAMLGMPIGLVTLLSVAATLITAIWLLEELEQMEADDADDVLPAPLPPLGGAPRP